MRFVVSNDDPINHELIVGPQSIHDRHRNGTEAEHPPRPGEISVGPDEQGVTRYTFDTPGTIEIACHLPGHYDYGMRGEVEVVPVHSGASTHGKAARLAFRAPASAALWRLTQLQCPHAIGTLDSRQVARLAFRARRLRCALAAHPVCALNAIGTLDSRTSRSSRLPSSPPAALWRLTQL